MAEPRDRPSYSLNPGPPPEASRYLRNKGFKPAFSWRDVEPEEHAVAFTVAKAMEMDLLAAMRAEVQRALDEGLPFETFQKNWRANPRLSDWWGRREMVDPDSGEIKEVQLGSPRRLKTIYNANLRTARAAGQWERIQRTKDWLPYLEYNIGPSERHRPLHAAKKGMILPVDAAFWDAWMPPNGFGCKCWVRQITRREAERRGISDEPEIVEATYSADVVGIDPGWQRNPGKARLLHAEMMFDDAKRWHLDEMQTTVALRDIATSWRVERIMAGAPGTAPVGFLPDALRREIGGLLHISDETKRHIVDEKLDRKEPSRAPFVEYLAQMPSATGAFVDATPHGRAWHLFVDDAASRGRGIYAVIWLVDGKPTLRTLFPATRSYFDKQSVRPSVTKIDLGQN